MSAKFKRLTGCVSDSNNTLFDRLAPCTTYGTVRPQAAHRVQYLTSSTKPDEERGSTHDQKAWNAQEFDNESVDGIIRHVGSMGDPGQLRSVRASKGEDAINAPKPKPMIPLTMAPGQP
jgi:hypothetical protein